MALLRLNYACELRYGVLVDLARCVWAQEEIELANGVLQRLWQGDANAMARWPSTIPPHRRACINVTGPELFPFALCAANWAGS